jgi:hypothetical protein
VYCTCAAEFFGLPLLPPSKGNGTDFKKGANMAIIGATSNQHELGLLPVSRPRQQDMEQRRPGHPNPVVSAAPAFHLRQRRR